MKRSRIGGFLCFLLALFTVLVPINKANAASLNCGMWSVVSSPNIGSMDNELYGVAAISANDVWAVGDYVDSSTDTFNTLIEQWNGTSWNVISSPNISGADNQLDGIAVVSANDIWAVGDYTIGTGNYQTLTEHWNGTSWNIVASPSPTSAWNQLTGVTAITTNNVWAVGFYFDQNDTSETALVEHWDGTSWNVVPAANPTTYNTLSAVTAISAKNIWAVGYATPANAGHELIEHWNGTSWKAVKSPTPLRDALYFGVSGSSAKDVWAVGYTPVSKTRTLQTLIDHWNGTAWSNVSSPNPGSGDDQLTGVAAISPNSAWAVGYDNLNATTLIEHWNGTVWSVVTSPNPSYYNILNGVASIKGTTDLWTVGQQSSQTLTEYYC